MATITVPRTGTYALQGEDEQPPQELSVTIDGPMLTLQMELTEEKVYSLVAEAPENSPQVSPSDSPETLKSGASGDVVRGSGFTRSPAPVAT